MISTVHTDMYFVSKGWTVRLWGYQTPYCHRKTIVSLVQAIVPRALCTPDKHSAAGPYPQPSIIGYCFEEYTTEKNRVFLSNVKGGCCYYSNFTDEETEVLRVFLRTSQNHTEGNQQGCGSNLGTLTLKFPCLMAMSSLLSQCLRLEVIFIKKEISLQFLYSQDLGIQVDWLFLLKHYFPPRAA